MDDRKAVKAARLASQIGSNLSRRSQYTLGSAVLPGAPKKVIHRVGYSLRAVSVGFWQRAVLAKSSYRRPIIELLGQQDRI